MSIIAIGQPEPDRLLRFNMYNEFSTTDILDKKLYDAAELRLGGVGTGGNMSFTLYYDSFFFQGIYRVAALFRPTFSVDNPVVLYFNYNENNNYIYAPEIIISPGGSPIFQASKGGDPQERSNIVTFKIDYKNIYLSYVITFESILYDGKILSFAQYSLKDYRVENQTGG